MREPFRAIIAFLVIIYISCSREDHICNPDATMYGFELGTYTPGYDGVLSAYIDSKVILEPIPEITLNGKGPSDDPIHVNSNLWYFDSIGNDTILYYRIVFKGDTLADTIQIPPPVDSLFWNENHLVPESAAYQWPDSIYRIRWKGHGVNKQFHFVLTAGKSIVERIDTIMNDSAISIRPRSQSDWTNVDIQVSNTKIHPFTSGTTPDKTSNKLFIYYRIDGPAYRSHFVVTNKRYY